MSNLMLARLLDGNDQPLSINAEYVIDPQTRQNMSDFIGRMENFKEVVDAFLTGEDNANEIIDRLSEIVAAIKVNKDLINTAINGGIKPEDIINDLSSGGVDKVLSAEQGKKLKELIDQLHIFSNAEVLDKIGVNSKGELTFDGKLIQGQTGIAIGTSPEEANSYTGKIKIILESVSNPDTEEEENS